MNAQFGIMSSFHQEYQKMSKNSPFELHNDKLWSSKSTPYLSYNIPSLANCTNYLKLFLTGLQLLLRGFFCIVNPVYFYSEQIS